MKNFCLRNSGKGIVVLITDLMDKNGYEAALRYLVAQRMDVYVIHVLEPGRARPRREGRPAARRLRRPGRGRDHGQRPLLWPLQDKRSTRSSTGAATSARRRGINYLLANNQTPVKELICELLAEAGTGAVRVKGRGSRDESQKDRRATCCDSKNWMCGTRRSNTPRRVYELTRQVSRSDETISASQVK